MEYHVSRLIAVFMLVVAVKLKCLRDSSLTNDRNSEKSYNGRSYTKEQIEKRVFLKKT